MRKAIAASAVDCQGLRSRSLFVLRRRKENRLRPRFCFDICWESYKAARSEVEKGGVRALDTSAFCGDRLWRPRWRPYLQDFCADFELAGVRALSDPHLASRLILFRLFHVGLAEYAPARHFLGVGEMTWVVWTEQIRELVGRELIGRGTLPGSRLFSGTVLPQA